MAHHSIIATPKNNRKIPKEIVEKAKDFYYLFPDDVNWVISEDKIGLCCHYSYFALVEQLMEALKDNYISQNMVDVYHWICGNADVGADCWNPCDFEYGPDSVDELAEDVRIAVECVKDWKGPIASMEETDIIVLVMTYDKNAHKLCVEMRSERLEIALPDNFGYVTGAKVKRDKLIVSFCRDGVLEIDLNGEIYDEKYIDAEVDRMYIYDVICLIPEALEEGRLIQISV